MARVRNHVCPEPGGGIAERGGHVARAGGSVKPPRRLGNLVNKFGGQTEEALVQHVVPGKHEA